MSSDIDIRVANEDDYPALFALLSAMHKEVALVPVNTGKVAAFVEDGVEKGEVLVACDSKGKILGTIGVIELPLWYSDSKILVDRFLYVARSERGQGIGKALLEAATVFSEVRKLLFVPAVTNPNRKAGRSWSRVFDSALFTPIGYGMMKDSGNVLRQ